MTAPSSVAGARAAVDLPAWLRGEWTVTRRINGDEGHFEGRARFSADPSTPGGLVWHEHGRLRLGAHDGPAERTLRLAPVERGAWEVRFADDRPFHLLDLSSGSWEATHLCGADTYRGRYEIESADRFSVTWRVTGPHKDDLITSSYTRCGELSSA